MTIVLDRFQGIQASVALKAPVRCATTGPITLSGFQTIDGQVLTSTDPNLRVLVKNQTDQTLNGIYKASSGIWTRDLDFDGNSDATYLTQIPVQYGTTNVGVWTNTTPDPFVIGTSNITFAFGIPGIGGVSTVANGGTGASTLTQYAVLVGNGTSAITQIPVPASGTLFQGNAAANPSWTATPTLGASGTLGSLTFGNATSGLVTLQTVTGALGSATLSLPAATDTLVGRATTDTLTNKTLTSPTLVTPALGTPSSGTLTNCTGFPASGLSGLGTGVGTALGIAVNTTGGLATSAVTSLPSLATVGTIGTGTWAGSVITVSHGGTGQTTLTTHGVLVGAGTSGITQLAAAAAGSILMGQGAGADPIFSSSPNLGVQQITRGQLIFANTAAGAFSVTLQSSNSATAGWTMTLPPTAGSNGQVLQTDGTGITSWVPTAGGTLAWYNVTAYASIAAAYSACAATGGVLYFPRGTYTGSRLTVSSPNVFIVGDGVNASILQFNLTFTSADNCGVQNIAISSVSSDNGISVTNTQLWVNNIRVTNCSLSGISCSGNNGFAIGGIIGSNVVIQSCGTDGLLLNNCNAPSLSNFIFLSNAGVQLHITGGTTGAVFVNGEISGSNGSATNALVISSSHFNKFSNVYFDSDAQGSTTTGGNLNVFSNCWWAGGRTSSGFSGMKVNSGIGTRFVNCEFLNCGAHGLEIAGGTYTTVDGCLADGNSANAGAGAAHGIVVDTGVQHVTITNTMATNGLTGFGTQGHGIVIAGSNNFYIVQGCNTQGNQSTGLVDSGGGGTKSVTGNI